ncbi:MAG: hypothetical protein SGBAC_010355 [Bacillariaceae sp.]
MAIQTSNSRVELKPWERFIDPNPFPSIAEIEESTSIEEVNSVLDQVMGTEGGIIIQQYKPDGDWLWRQFYGTVIYSAWPRALLNMAWATVFCTWVRYYTYGDFDVFTLQTVGDESSVVSTFVIIEKIYAVLMSLTTFLLTFFVGQSWAFWRSFIDVSRNIQGRFTSIQMLLTSHAARDEKTGTYTPEAELFLRDMAQRLKLFHTLYWASQSRRFCSLLSDKGWDGMVARGLVSDQERKRLQALKLSPTQKHMGVFQSTLVTSQKGMTDKKVIATQQTDLLEGKIVDEFCRLRGTTGTIADLVAGRMPLAYVHFVELLVDTFLLCTPIAKYADLGIYSVLMIGILTFFYHGLLILAKVFLDPLDNESYKVGCVYLDLAVLLRESNGGIDRWIDAAETI